MSEPLYPVLYQINTRVLLTELSRSLGRPATLDDIADAELDRLAQMGFDWLWFLSVWSTGPAGQRVSREHQEWRREFEQTLPDLRDEETKTSPDPALRSRVTRSLRISAGMRRSRDCGSACALAGSS